MGRRRRRALIRAPARDELAVVADFVATLQGRPQDRISSLGKTAGEIAALLESWETPWIETSLVEERDSRIVAFLGAELDESLNRAWLYGPLVEGDDWDAVADELLATLGGAVPRTAGKRHELDGDTANERLAALAARHGFVATAVHFVLQLEASAVAALPPAVSGALPPVQDGAFVALHDSTFPGTYYSGTQLLERANTGDAVIVGAVDTDRLVGYAAGQIDEGSAGYIDFVGVAPDNRRRGIGRDLVVSLCRALAERTDIPYVHLSVSSENAAALALYHGLGFRRASSMVGYRREPEPRP